MCCNGSTLVWNARDVGSSSALDIILPIFITPTTNVWIDKCLCLSMITVIQISTQVLTGYSNIILCTNIFVIADDDDDDDDDIL